MLKLQILSDLHLEFAPISLPNSDADIVILAGDIDVGSKGIEWANETFSVPVVYVLGNHELYGGHIDRTLAECRALAQPHVHVLERDALEIDGVRFLGCTLWTDFDLFGEARRTESLFESQRAMSDFRVIRASLGETQDAKLTAWYTRELHRQARGWLESQLLSGDPQRTIVVTHHAPHCGSLAPEFANDLMSGAFVSDLENLMGRAALWIHGHTHGSFDYHVAGTRVVCNPRGYPAAANRRFQPNLLVEVDGVKNDCL